MSPPSAEIQQHFFVVIGILLLMGGGIFSVVRGYKWLLGEFNTLLKEAFAQHEKDEDSWKTSFSKAIEEMKALIARVDVHVEKIETRVEQIEAMMEAMEREREVRHRLEDEIRRRMDEGVAPVALAPRFPARPTDEDEK